MKRQLFILVWGVLLFVACGGPPTVPEPTAVQTSELQRVASLLAAYEVEERPLPFSPETIQAKAGLHVTTPDENIDIFMFELVAGGNFVTAVSLLADQGIDVAAEAPLSFAGTNGSVLFVVRNVAPPDQQEAARYLVSEISGALAGQE